MTRVGSISTDASLEMSVEQARRSFACAFSSSEEFEAALIQERRAAGHYGPRYWQTTFRMVFGIATGVLILLFAIGL